MVGHSGGRRNGMPRPRRNQIRSSHRVSEISDQNSARPRKLSTPRIAPNLHDFFARRADGGSNAIVEGRQLDQEDTYPIVVDGLAISMSVVKCRHYISKIAGSNDIDATSEIQAMVRLTRGGAVLQLKSKDKQEAFLRVKEVTIDIDCGRPIIVTFSLPKQWKKGDSFRNEHSRSVFLLIFREDLEPAEETEQEQWARVERAIKESLSSQSLKCEKVVKARSTPKVFMVIVVLGTPAEMGVLLAKGRIVLESLGLTRRVEPRYPWRKREKKCYHCSEWGHTTKSCTNQPRCGECGENGHTLKDPRCEKANGEKAGEDTPQFHCADCADAGLPSSHSFGAAGCRGSSWKALAARKLRVKPAVEAKAGQVDREIKQLRAQMELLSEKLESALKQVAQQGQLIKSLSGPESAEGESDYGAVGQVRTSSAQYYSVFGQVEAASQTAPQEVPEATEESSAAESVDPNQRNLLATLKPRARLDVGEMYARLRRGASTGSSDYVSDESDLDLIFDT